MKLQATVFFLILVMTLLTGFISQAYAAQMTAVLLPSTDKAQVNFTGVQILELKYQADSAIANELNGKKERLNFTVTGSVTNDNGTGMSQLIRTVNDDLLTSTHSLVQIGQASLTYTATINGNPTSALFAYKVDFVPTIQNFIISGGASAQETVIDLSWRSLVIQQPLNVNVPNVGKVNVNYPIGLFEIKYPDLGAKLENTEAKAILESPILSFHRFGPPDAPMDVWHFLFDATGAQAGGSVLLNSTAGSSKVDSIYALGESSFREGVLIADEKSVDVNVDGITVTVHSNEPPPSGQLIIGGYARADSRGGTEVAVVTPDAPPGATASGGFPIQVLLVFGGMMGAISVFILLKARK